MRLRASVAWPVFLSLGQFACYLVLLHELSGPYAYAKLAFELANIEVVGTALVLSGAIGLLLPTALKQPSDAVLWCLATFVVIPSLAFTAAGSSYPLSDRWGANVITLSGFIALRLFLPRRVTALRLNRWMVSPRFAAMALMVIGLFLLAVVLASYARYGFDLSYDDLYERRLALRSAEAFPGMSYVFSFFTDVLAPLSLIVGLVWWRPNLMLLGVAGGLVAFGIMGTKSSIAALILAPAAVICFLRGRRSESPLWPAFLTAVIALPTAVALIFGNLFFAVLLPRRLGLVPASLTIEYERLANGTGNTYFTQHLLKWILPEEQRASIGQRVGALLDPSGGLNANANVWADGYVSGGLVGVVITSAAMAIILHTFNRIAVRTDVRIVGAMATTVCAYWLNGYLPTSIVTGGVAMALVALWLLPVVDWRPPLPRGIPQGGPKRRATRTDYDITADRDPSLTVDRSVVR